MGTVYGGKSSGLVGKTALNEFALPAAAARSSSSGLGGFVECAIFDVGRILGLPTCLPLCCAFFLPRTPSRGSFCAA